MSNTTDRDGNVLVPGALYVTMTRNPAGDRDGPFVYWTGGQLVTEDGDDVDQIEFDYLVRQAGDINEDMIEAEHDGAQAASAYYATGGDL